MMIIFIYLICFNQTQSSEIQQLDPLYQVAHQSVMIEDLDFMPKKYFSFGIWSKYNPLSSISQTGLVGLFDSNFYQLFHIIDKKSNQLNFIYYDCLDYEAKTITKAIKFVNDEDEQYIYEIEVEIFEYESFWYFLEVLSWPLQKRFELLIISQSKIIIHNIDEIKYPFKGTNLQFTFGSSLIVRNSRIESVQNNQKFSYFPGQIIIQKFEIENELTVIDWFEYVKNIFLEYELCQCQPNNSEKYQDQTIKTQFKKTFVSENQNCDSYILSGWFKISEIIQEDDQFIYPFLQLASNFEDPKLFNDNLSPLQIQYYLSDIQNQIIVKTYSYTFPIVSIDFSNNPFLIVKTIDISNNIQLWHKIQVKLIKNQMAVQIKFYELSIIHEYNYLVDVHQFQSQQFKLVYGNIQQLQSNYLTFLVQNFLFLNCNLTFAEQNCHKNCKECDGPTYEDCLSCSEESMRIYLPEYKVCVCPYNTIDDEICIGYKETNLEFIDEPFINSECQFGYFEIDNECYKCPSIIRNDLIICVGCVYNPKFFSAYPYCESDLYFGQSNQTESLQMSELIQFLFDGNDVSVPEFNYYQVTEINDIQKLQKDFFQKLIPFQLFCEECLPNDIFGCQKQYLSIAGVQCILCSTSQILENGKCKDYEIQDQNQCHSPYYTTSFHKCKLCPIQNCIYCFEYIIGEDSFKSTLYKNFEIFNIVDEKIDIGCAMCKNGYIFDFTNGKCFRKQSQILSCLRSFLNLDGIEICTLSSQTDFSISPEIINCQKYLSNCLQCVLTPLSKLQCVICSQGYFSSKLTGNCQEITDNDLQNALVVIQGDYYEVDGYIQLIQSFMMQFLPDKYYYQYNSKDLQLFATECQTGYELTKSQQCEQYCSSGCLSCSNGYFYFVCNKCQLNYYRKHIRVEIFGQCVTCSNLCKFCLNRSLEEIQILQSNFQLQESNAKFTMSCMKQIDHPNVTTNPYLQIAKYCFNEQCYNSFSLSSYRFCFQDIYFPEIQELNINLQYCNLIGVDKITKNYVFQIEEQFKNQCEIFDNLEFFTKLKEKIFSLKQISMSFFSIVENIFTLMKIVTISNYDSVEIKNITLILYQGFLMENTNNKIDITLKHVNLIHSSFSDQTLIQTQVYGNILFQEVNITESFFKSTTFFNFSKQSISLSITIQKLTIKNCILDNSILFNISYVQAIITIEKILIQNCSLLNSSFFYFSTDLKIANQIKILDIDINQCNFTFSYFLISYNKFNIIANNLIFNDNKLKNSTIIAFIDNIELISIKTSQNTLIGSQILRTEKIIDENNIQCTIDDFEDNLSSFLESSLIFVFSNLQINQFIVSIKNVKVQQNILINTIYQNFLFKFHCHQLVVQNVQLYNLQNVAVFYLFEINQIIFDSVIFENFQQEHKVPISQICTNQVQIRSQLLQIIGFQKVKISNIKIVNQFSINYSLIDINFSTYFIIDSIGLVILVNFQLIGNILLKNKQATALSLLSINSEYNLNIELIDFQFTQNIINQQINELFDKQTNLLYISSLDSFVRIHQFYFYQNALTNSTNPFITFTATFIEMSNFIFMYSNVLSQHLWLQFYDFELDNQYNQQEINIIIQSTFKILNQGIFILTSTFRCTNSVFQEIIAYKSSIFYIKTQGQGIIQVNDVSIDSVQTNLRDSESTGCINIDSTNSLLNIDLKQITFNKIYNRMAASLFTIAPSLTQNVIRLNNIEIKNCLSLMNAIMFVKFSAQTNKQSLVSINNLSIYQSEEFWIQLFSLIGPITFQELDTIQNEENAMILLENCKVEIKNLNAQGITISPIFKFQNVFKLKLFDCNLVSIQKLYSFDLIRITQTLIDESIISIEKLKIINSVTYKLQSDVASNVLDQNYKILGCKFWKNESMTAQNIFSQTITEMQSSNLQSNQLMFVKSISSKNSFIFQQIEIKNNNGSDFSNGIIIVEVDQFKIFKINNIICIENYVKAYGCIYFSIQNTINSILKIKDSNFIQNIGSLGGAIFIQNVRLKMSNCKILSNFASNSGGGLFLQLMDSDFLIESTIITNNKALNGGGIYFQQKGTILLNNFIKSFLLFNKAIQFGNNLFESPHHLALLINNIEMQSKKEIINQLVNYHLVIKPYTIIEQGNAFLSNQLMIPSYQVIDKYQIYYPKSYQYFSYISNFALMLKNSLQEQIPNVYNTTCILVNKVIQKESLDQIGEQTEQTILQYDAKMNYYNLGSLSFILDPYNQEEKILQIEIKCQSTTQQNSMKYTLQAKSLKCQLGEFFVNSGCQMCQSSQGYYSVVYDAIKCSIFDKNKYKNITENNIELLEGFWRPNYLSDQIEECYKNLQFCKGGWGQGDQLCDLGHIGALCEECDIYDIRGNGKYFKNQENSKCISCFGVEDSIIPFLAGSIWSFLSIIITLRSIEQSNQLFKSLKLTQRFNKILFNIEQGNESFLIKMLINYLWIFSVIFTFNITFSFSFSFVDSASNTSNSMTNNLDCYLSQNQSIKLIYSKIITMVVLMIFQFLLIIFGFLLYNWYKKIVLKKFQLEIISNTLLYLYISNYGGLAKMYFSILSKRNVSSQSYIQGDLSLLFGSKEHLIWIFSFVIPGIGVFSLIIPLSLFTIMYTKKGQHDNIQIRKHFCYLINEYNTVTYYWEVIKLFKKTIIILILTYFETFILLKASLLGLCLLFYQLFAFNKKPYILSNFNIMDLYSAQICSITIFLAAVKYVSEQENNQFSSVSLQTIIILLCVRLCYSFFKSILEVYSIKYTFLILNQLLLILNQILPNSIFTKKLNKFIQTSNQRKKRLKFLVSRLKQYLLRLSKSQIESSRRFQNNLNQKTQSLGSQQKYYLKIDTE